MNRREAERLTRQQDTLLSLGFTQDEAESLRRISMTLHRWYERECGVEGGCIERDEKTGRPYWFNSNARYADPYDPRAYRAIPDREKGAHKRLAGILRDCSARMLPPQSPDKLTAYVQTDPRGAALYLIRPGDIPAGSTVDGYYPCGICVY